MFSLHASLRLGVYQHYKGGMYRLIGMAKHSETLEEMVVYQALNTEDLWVRPRVMWDETVQVNGTNQQRFTYQEE